MNDDIFNKAIKRQNKTYTHGYPTPEQLQQRIDQLIEEKKDIQKEFDRYTKFAKGQIAELKAVIRTIDEDYLFEETMYEPKKDTPGFKKGKIYAQWARPKKNIFVNEIYLINEDGEEVAVSRKGFIAIRSIKIEDYLIQKAKNEKSTRPTQ